MVELFTSTLYFEVRIRNKNLLCLVSLHKTLYVFVTEANSLPFHIMFGYIVYSKLISLVKLEERLYTIHYYTTHM